MHDFVEPARSAQAARRSAGIRHSGLGMAVLLLAGLLVPAPGNFAIAAIAAAGLIVMGAQHVILRRLIARSAQLIATQEALLAGALTSRKRSEVLFALTGAEAGCGDRDGVRNGKALASRSGGARARGRKLAA
jgi:hypothetical protein